MLARSRRTRPCGIRCAAAAVMLAQSRRTRPCGIRCAAAVVMLAQSRRTRPCGRQCDTAAIMLAQSRRIRPCECHCATAAVILELHPTDPTLPRLSTETTRTRFALWTWVGHAPASADSHRGNENVSCHVACDTEIRCVSMTVSSTKVTTCDTKASVYMEYLPVR